MGNRDNTSKLRKSRNQTKQAASAAAASADSAGDAGAPRMKSRLEEAIEAERAQLLQVQGVLKCLHEVLLYLDHEYATLYADVAKLAAKLIDESVERLDFVRLAPMIEGKNQVRDSGVGVYFHSGHQQSCPLSALMRRVLDASIGARPAPEVSAETPNVKLARLRTDLRMAA